MAVENIINFFNALDSNEALNYEFSAIPACDTFKEQLVKLASKYHYEFTLEELNEVAEAAKRLRDGEEAKDAE